MPKQYRNVPRTIEAHKFDGSDLDLATLVDWGADIRRDASGVAVLQLARTYSVVTPTDWVVRTEDGHIVIPDDEFQENYVERTPADRDELRFNLTLHSGSKVDITIGGLADARDGYYTLMQMARPETILEYLKEQAIAGDMSVLTLTDELAALANPGE